MVSLFATNVIEKVRLLSSETSVQLRLDGRICVNTKIAGFPCITRQGNSKEHLYIDF